MTFQGSIVYFLNVALNIYYVYVHAHGVAYGSLHSAYITQLQIHSRQHKGGCLISEGSFDT